MTKIKLFKEGRKREEISPEDFRKYEKEFFPENTIRKYSYDKRVKFVSKVLTNLAEKARNHIVELGEETGQSQEMLEDEIDKIEMASDKRYLNKVKEIGGLNLEHSIDDWTYDPETNQYRKAAPLGKGVSVNPGHNPAGLVMPIIWPPLSGNSILHKMPSKDQLTLKLLNEVFEELENPVAESSAIAQWKGGDEDLINFEKKIFSKDYVMAWGDDSTIKAISRKVPPHTRLIPFHYEYGCYMVGQAFQRNYEEEVMMDIAEDFSWGDQNVCFSPQFLLVEKSDETDAFIENLIQAMKTTARKWPRGELPTSVADRIRENEWTAEQFGWLRTDHEDFSIIVREEKPDSLGRFTGYRFVEIYVVEELQEGFELIEKSRNLQEVVLAVSNKRRNALRDNITSKTNANRITVPGEALPSRPIPWDGRIPLNDLLKWTTDERKMPKGFSDFLLNKLQSTLKKVWFF